MMGNTNNKIESFNDYIKVALSNIDAWNKKVKSKKYIINKSDTYNQRINKIYRYANKHEK
tara:strand:+ start:222 stop:401 length:180 start_codon:yes stop_codon:yes gene_type:complete